MIALLLPNNLSADVSPFGDDFPPPADVATQNPQASASGNVTAAPAKSDLSVDETAIMADRENAMQNVLEQFQAENGNGAKRTKINLGEREAGRDEKSGRGFSWRKLFFGSESKGDPEPDAAVVAQKIKTVKPTESEEIKFSREKFSSEPKLEEMKQGEAVPAESAKGRETKRRSWIPFLGRHSAENPEVAEKRKERAAQFPALDSEQIKESITATKLEMKREFLSQKDHTLENVVERAIQVHLPVQIAYEKVSLAERRIKKAFRDFFSEASLSKTTKDGTISGGPYKHRDWRASLRQPLYRGGVLWNTFKLEMASRDVSRRELDQILSDLVADASNAYFEYERAWSVLEEKQALKAEAQKFKTLSDEKAKANLIAEIEKLNVESTYSNVEFELETATQDLELAKLELQKVLELETDDPIELKPFFRFSDLKGSGMLSGWGNSVEPLSAAGAEPVHVAPDVSAKMEELERFVDLAYLHRPDLQVEASKLRAASLTHKISKGKLLPSADLVVEFGKLGEAFEGADRLYWGDLETTKPHYHKEWRIGTELSWNLAGNTVEYSFDHDQRAPSLTQYLGSDGPITETKTVSIGFLDNLNALAELKETKIAVLEEVVELDKVERNVIRDVKEAYFNYHKAAIQAEANYKRMEYRERLVDIAKHRLGNNEIQISEYMQTMVDYAEEKTNVLKALAELYNAKVNLNRAIGLRNYVELESRNLKETVSEIAPDQS